MEITRFASAQPFLVRAGPFLVQREAEHNLLLGLAGQLERDLLLYGSQPYLAVAEANGGIAGVALMTPPNNLVLSHIADAAALPAFAAELARFEAAPPGVLAAPATAATFAAQWCAPRGLRARRSLAERIFQLEAVRSPPMVPGHLRPATIADRALLVAWFNAFHAEAIPEHASSDASAAVDRRLSTPGSTLFVWEDGEPVTLVGVSGATPRGIRVGPVYTPPAHRRRGYASAAVAAASQLQLDAGRTFCFLYTDLSNPTSNHIYQTIGYTPVADVDDLRFEPV